jgi:hypothetical protein
MILLTISAILLLSVLNFFLELYNMAQANDILLALSDVEIEITRLAALVTQLEAAPAITTEQSDEILAKVQALKAQAVAIV